MKKILIQSGVELYFGRHLPTDLVQTLCQKWGHRSIELADANLHLSPCSNRFSFVPHKTREDKQALEDRLFQAGYGRDSIIVAIGGGTTTDLVGFLAATYMRGVPLILVPTTLIAMVDAAIGGKTSVDTPSGKNLVGAFYLPRAIVVDLAYLDTLPDAEWVNGRSEIIKMSLVYDASLLESKADEQILQSILAKVAIVELDPFETGIRRILNFGHTIGHAIELCSDYQIAHGEAVALGCIAESYLSMQMGFLAPDQFQRVLSLFPKFKWSYDRKKLLDAMNLDKKKANGKLRFVLISKIGESVPFEGQYCSEVPSVLLEKALEWMELEYV